MSEVTEDEKFLFDIQGFLILRGAIEQDLISALDSAVVENEAKDHDESWATGLPTTTSGHFTKDLNIEHQVRLNGLPRLNPIFDALIAHPAILPYLEAFMGAPQLVNTWSISKYEGRDATGWHNGIPMDEYLVRDGVIHSPMLNVVTMLTPNHPGDGCFTVIPGSHKRRFNLRPEWKTAGLETPGAIEVTGDPGDVMLFTEALHHAGAAKTNSRRRTTLQYNHLHRNRASIMWDTHNSRHYWMPPSIRERFTPAQKDLTRWMGYTLPERGIPGAERIEG
jgi:ectoine hydroxylase-related dioxygenase (phytanoyl-CoA dioxygenase family)